MKRLILCAATIAMVTGLSSQGYASLIVRGTDTLGNRIIYDNDRNLTWYDFTNTVGSWNAQLGWAAGLSVEYSGTTYTDWFLPSSDTSCDLWNCINSDMGHLYYTELGGEAGVAGLNTGVFQNLLTEDYWSNTPLASGAIFFNFNEGRQGVASTAGENYAIAVRVGDVPSMVPLPAAVWLFGSGLLGLAVMARMKAA
jgi:hypothetical protein